MTNIKPNKKNKNSVNLILLLLAPAILEAVWLIKLSNSAVDLSHGLSAARTEIQKTESENAEMKNQLYSLFDKANLVKIASEKGLVEEKIPQYLITSNQWDFVSRY